MKIVSRYNSETVLYESEKQTLKEAVVDAVNKNAYLQGADLRDAYLREGIKINLIPIQVSSSRYYITIWDKHMQIGCKFHSIAEWFGFDNRTIAEMDGKNALEFWNKWKEPLQAICNAEGRG